MLLYGLFKRTSPVGPSPLTLTALRPSSCCLILFVYSFFLTILTLFFLHSLSLFPLSFSHYLSLHISLSPYPSLSLPLLFPSLTFSLSVSLSHSLSLSLSLCACLSLSLCLYVSLSPSRSLPSGCRIMQWGRRSAYPGSAVMAAPRIGRNLQW
jgi:hypothetical protein